ncbi:MAG: hypothetical protein AAGD34_10450 [Pseudomonadota bacterium]
MPTHEMTSRASAGLVLEERVVDGHDRTLVHLLLKNPSPDPVDDWHVDLSTPDYVVGVFGGALRALGSNTYKLCPDRWTGQIAPGGEIEVGLVLVKSCGLAPPAQQPDTASSAGQAAAA